MNPSLVLAHHPVVEALPAVLPAVVLSGAFALIVWSDRRRARRERAVVASAPATASSGSMEPCPRN